MYRSALDAKKTRRTGSSCSALSFVAIRLSLFSGCDRRDVMVGRMPRGPRNRTRPYATRPSVLPLTHWTYIHMHKLVHGVIPYSARMKTERRITQRRR